MIDSWCSFFSEHEKFTRFFEGLSEGPPPSIQREENKLKRKFASAILMQRSLRSLVHRSPARNPIKRYTSPYAKTIYFGSLEHASILIQNAKVRNIYEYSSALSLVLHFYQTFMSFSISDENSFSSPCVSRSWTVFANRNVFDLACYGN